MTVSWRYYLLFMTKNNDHYCDCILPTNVVITICYINIRFAQNTTQTLIGGELKTTPAFVRVSARWRCLGNKLTVRLALGRFVVRHLVGNSVLVWMGFKSKASIKMLVLINKIKKTNLWKASNQLICYSHYLFQLTSILLVKTKKQLILQ